MFEKTKINEKKARDGPFISKTLWSIWPLADYLRFFVKANKKASVA